MPVNAGTAHRANYTLEIGIWHATCRTCGYTVADPLRRRAAAIFRYHIRDIREADEADLVDLTGDEAPEVEIPESEPSAVTVG
jgi:hypothetical protein